MSASGNSDLAALFLGVIQGLTEFLPVSSSGHLVLLQQYVDLDQPVLFDVFLHVGTLLPVLWTYRSEWIGMVRDTCTPGAGWASRDGTQWMGLIAVASAPTAAIGLTFKDTFEGLFSNPSMLTITFLVTGIILWMSGRFDQSQKETPLNWRIACILGLAQGFAITPGISRSGTTIAVALMLGLRRDHAARFSFLMSVPAILGALALQAQDVSFDALDVRPFLLGAMAALVAGQLALVALIRLVNRGRLSAFAPYLVLAAAVAGTLSLGG